MSDASHERPGLSIRTAIGFVILLGVVSLFGDMTYEGGRSLVGQFLNILGASAAAVGVAAGAGELLGYGLRFFSGLAADRTKRYWPIVILGYVVQLFALPALALVGHWQIAIVLVFAERIGKGIRNPPANALLSYAAAQTGRGFGFGLHEAMDQIGAFLGPVALSAVLYFKARAEAGSAGIDAGYRTGFALLAIPAVLAIATVVIARFLFPRPADLESKTPKIATRGFSRAFWLYIVASGLVAAGFADFALIAFHFKRVALVPDYWIPTMFAVAMAVDAGAALLFGVLYDRVGLPVMLAAFGLSMLFAPFVYLGGPALAVVGLALWGIGMGAQESIMRAAVADLAPGDRRATAFGLFYTGFGIFWFAGSSLMGVLYDWHVVAIVVFSVAVQAAALPVFYAAARAKAKER